RRLMETKLADNRDPPRYKISLTDVLISFDLNSHQPIGFVSATLRKEYGGYDLYNMSASYDVDQYGFGTSYTRLFGRIVDRLRLTHGVNIGYNFSRLADEFHLVTDPSTGSQQVVKVGNAEFVSTLSATYFFGDHLS